MIWNWKKNFSFSIRIPFMKREKNIDLNYKFSCRLETLFYIFMLSCFIAARLLKN